MRLIDADSLRKDVENDRDASDMPKMWYQGVENAINHIIHAPTVDAVPLEDYKSMERTVNKLTKAFADAVEVVRCKDCVYFWDGVCTAHTDVIYTDENEFCSWAERRTDE